MAKQGAAGPVPTRVTPGQQRRYYGWTLVGTLGLTELVSWGVVYYAFGVMLAPMQQELGWSRTHLTGAFSLALLLSGLAAVPIGRVLDRHGTRAIMTIGSCAATLLVVAWAQVDTLWAFYTVWAGLGVTMAAIFYEPAFAVVTTWFVQQRQRALTVLTVGGGLASVVFVPAATALLERYGWRVALLVLAGILGVVTIPLHALVLRRHPHDLGVVPDGGVTQPPHEASVSDAHAGVSLRMALRGSTFWWLSAAFALSVLASVTMSVQFLAYLAERGYDANVRALAAAVLGGAQLPGRIIFTPLGARVARQRVAALLFGLQLGGLLLLLAVPSTWGVLGFALLFGAGAGALTPARAALVADFYGTAQYGSISGSMALVTTLARALAPIGSGALYTTAGSYTPLWWTLVICMLGGLAALLLARQHPRLEGDPAHA